MSLFYIDVWGRGSDLNITKCIFSFFHGERSKRKQHGHSWHPLIVHNFDGALNIWSWFCLRHIAYITSYVIYFSLGALSHTNQIVLSFAETSNSR